MISRFLIFGPDEDLARIPILIGIHCACINQTDDGYFGTIVIEDFSKEHGLRVDGFPLHLIRLHDGSHVRNGNTGQGHFPVIFRQEDGFG